MMFVFRMWVEMFRRYMGEEFFVGGRVWGVRWDGGVVDLDDDEMGICLWLVVVVGEFKGVEVFKVWRFW